MIDKKIGLSGYVGAELYNKRMFPHGCPSYQKAFVKLFKIEIGKQGKERMKLIDSQFFNNRDGFGFMLRDLQKGKYQIHFKKYSSGFDVYDFTVRMYGERQIKFIDDEEVEIKKVKLTKEMVDKIPKIGQKPSENAAQKIDKSKEAAGSVVSDPLEKVT